MLLSFIGMNTEKPFGVKILKSLQSNYAANNRFMTDTVLVSFVFSPFWLYNSAYEFE